MYICIYLQGELSFAAVLSKKLLLEKFKNLDPKLVMNVLHANEYKLQVNKCILQLIFYLFIIFYFLQKASDVLSEISGIGCLTTLDNPDIVVIAFYILIIIAVHI